MRDKPTREWTYREIECKVYQHQEPDSCRLRGYAKIGDEWVEATEVDGDDIEKAVKRTESHVDTMLMKATMENSGDPNDSRPFEIDPEPIEPGPWPSPSPAPRPKPAPNPNPQPKPLPPTPVWCGETYTTNEDDDTLEQVEAGTIIL